MVIGVRTLSSKRSIEAGLIRGSKDLFLKESYEENLRDQIDGVLKNFKKKSRYDRQKLVQLFDQFIKSVEGILERLETAKRNAVSEEYKTLQELQILIKEEGIITISKKLDRIEDHKIFDVLRFGSAIARAERVVSKNRAPPGYFLKKMRSNRSLTKDMRKKILSISRNRTESTLRKVIGDIREARGKGKVIDTKLESEIIDILDKYYENFENEFQIQIDVDITEARNLHQIAKYIRFANILKMPEYTRRLEILKTRADNFVNQDAANSKQMRKIMARMFEVSKQLEFADKAEITIFDDIKVKGIRFRTESGVLIGGTTYIRTAVYNGKGVVAIPGIFSTRKLFDLLSKRLAYQGYAVLAIDLPSQAESHGDWRLGLMSEFVYASVQELRKNVFIQAKKVAVIGHSAGAAASMFAALSYNREIEIEIFQKFETYFELVDEMEELIAELVKLGKELPKPGSKGYLNSKQIVEKNRVQVAIDRVQARMKQIGTEFETSYNNIKSLIVKSLKSGRFKAKIDSFVVLSLPPKFQEVLPPFLLKSIGRFKHSHIRKVINVLINNPLKWNLLTKINPMSLVRHGPQVEFTGPDAESKAVQIYFLRIPELREFMEYVATVKNPCDYVGLLNQFGERNPILGGILNRTVKQQPKLFMYGRWDGLLKGFTPKLLLTGGLRISKKRQEEISAVYSLMENIRGPIVVPNTSHFLNENDYASVNLRNEGIQDKRVVREILKFLEETL